MNNESTIDAPVIDVSRICELAHLDIPPEEAAKFQAQLADVIGYVRKIGELDLSGIEPTVYGRPLSNVFREDKAAPGLSQEDALANAPDKIGGEFKLPKIVE